jgi:hypothetical protein
VASPVVLVALRFVPFASLNPISKLTADTFPRKNNETSVGKNTFFIGYLVRVKV